MYQNILHFFTLGFPGRCRMCRIDFRDWAASLVKQYPTFRWTLQLPSSGWWCQLQW